MQYTITFPSRSDKKKTFGHLIVQCIQLLALYIVLILQCSSCAEIPTLAGTSYYSEGRGQLNFSQKGYVRGFEVNDSVGSHTVYSAGGWTLANDRITLFDWREQADTRLRTVTGMVSRLDGRIRIALDTGADNVKFIQAFPED